VKPLATSILLPLLILAGTSARAADAAAVPVDVHNFVRAETDLYFGRAAASGALGRFTHRREMAAIDAQDVVRMNRDTLYSMAVFDLQAGPVTITLPDTGRRFMSMQVVNQDHFTPEVVYAPGRYRYDQAKVGTRYVQMIVRTLADPQDPADLQAAHVLQDALRAEQASVGRFEAPAWDEATQTRARDSLAALAALGNIGPMFGKRGAVDPIDHLIGTAVGWGGNPPEAAVYQGSYPAANDGSTVHELTVRDVPVDGFWSISVYDAKGYFAKNELNAYSLNNLTAKPNADGSFTVRFGGCGAGTPNCLPITPGWNYTVRLYRPRTPILDGTWTFPEAQPLR
jgi:para-nitrobenzyl esterase